MKKLIATATLAALAFVFGTSVALASDPTSLIKTWDPDHDGTLDIHEVTSAATAQFGVLDVDNDGTLDLEEAAKAGIDKAELTAHDPDNDGTLDMNEYMTIVQKRFKAADTDNSGTIDKAELMTPEGKALTKVALASGPASLIKKWDPDHDGTLDIHEVTSAATAHFGVLDPDNDGTLDLEEAAKAGIDKAEFTAHDPDNDGTLDMNEYMTIVQKRFKAADTDNSGTIDKAELMTPEGKALTKLLSH